MTVPLQFEEKAGEEGIRSRFNKIMKVVVNVNVQLVLESSKPRTSDHQMKLRGLSKTDEVHLHRAGGEAPLPSPPTPPPRIGGYLVLIFGPLAHN